MKPEMFDEQVEPFYLLLLSRSNQVLKKHLVFTGELLEPVGGHLSGF